MTILNPHLLPKLRSEALMASASGQPCATRVSSFFPGYSCSGTNTTIGAHLPVHGKGTSTKVTDGAVVYSCQHCHDIIDGPDKKRRDYIIENYPTAFMERLLMGLVETHQRLLMEGIIVVPDGEFI